MSVKVKSIGGVPVFRAVLDDEECGMLRVSLVDAPAVDKDFEKFAKSPVKYAVSNEEKRLVRGCVMRADFPMYRYEAEFGEYYVVFDAATIRQMAEKYIAEGRCNAVNLQHVDGSDVEGVQMVQMFIKGDGVSVDGFDDCADGSLFAEYHVVNDDVWEEIKAGTFKGFSIEVIHDLIPNGSDYAAQLRAAFLAINPTKNDMSKFDKFLNALGRLLDARYGEMTSDKGVIAWDGDEPLKEGDAVQIVAEDGTRSDAEDGEYTADSKIYTIEGGKVVSIADVPAKAEEFGKVATDKGELNWDGEGDLEAGVAVFVDEGEERAPAEDGEYVTEDGKIIVVADGKVAEIKDKEAEVATEEFAKQSNFDELADRVAALENMVAKLCDYLGILVIKEEDVAAAAPVAEQLSKMRAEIAALKKTPAGTTAHQEFRKNVELPKASNPREENLFRILRAGK